MNKIVTLIISLFLLGCNNSKQQEKEPSKKYSSKIDSLMQVSFDRGIFNGNVLVTRNDSLIYQKSFGYTDGSAQTQLTKESIFCPGSIAKEFVAVSIMMLVEKGELNLDDKLSQFDLNLPAWSEKISVKHLLNYVDGLPKIDWENIKNENDNLEDLQNLKNLLFEPGTDFHYNVNSIFLQKRIIESITKKPFQEFVKTHIITPLKMNDAVFDPDFDYPNRTRSYDIYKQNAVEFYPTKGWLWTTTDDMNKWITGLRQGKLISRASLIPLLKNQYFESKGTILGGSDEEFKIQEHGGQSYQFEAAFISEFDSELSIVLMSNHKNQTFEIIKSVHNIMKGKPFELPKKSIHREIRQKCLEDINEGIKYYYALKKSDYDIYNFDNPNGLNSLGYDLLGLKKVNESITIFKLAVSEFPKDANLYDSLAEAYYTNKQYDLALLNYEKSLEMNPKNTNAKDMIEKINNILKN